MYKNGKLLYRNGKLAIDQRCCECEPTCSCDALCATIHARIIFQGKGCPDPATCTTSEVANFDMEEGDIGAIPGEQPLCITVNRYWSGTPTLSCGEPAEPLIEMACCTIGGSPIMYNRINGGSWCKISSEITPCDQYWARTSIAEIDTLPSCCGAAALQAWCDGYEQPLPECNLVPTGTLAGGCN